MATVSTPISRRDLSSNYETAERDSDQWDFSVPDPLDVCLFLLTTLCQWLLAG